MDFEDSESWLASWFVRRIGLERYVALEAAETLLYDMRREGIDITMRRDESIGRPRQDIPRSGRTSEAKYVYSPYSRRGRRSRRRER